MSPAVMDELVLRWAPIPNTAQEAFFDDDLPDGNLLLQGGWGSGKTMTLIAKMLKLSAINAPLLGVWTVPDFGHVTRTILPTLTETDKDGRPWFLTDDQFHYNEKGHTLTWIGGGPIQFCSDEEPDKIAGPNAAFAGTDEPGTIKQKSWRNTCARVRHVRANLRQKVAAGTPEGITYLLDYFGADRTDKYRLYTIATHENIELIKDNDEYIKQAMASMTDAEVSAYLGGQAVNIYGALAYPAFNAERQWASDAAGPDKTYPLVATFDFNVDPMVCVLGQAVAGPFGLEPHVVDMVTLYGGSTVDQTCDELLRRYPKWPAGWHVYGDATAKARNVKSLKSNYDLITERLRASGHVTVKVPIANPPVSRRLNSVNRLCLNALQQTRLWIRKTEPARACATRPLILSLQRTLKKAGTDDLEKKPGETVTHPGDALGYWLDYEWPAQKPMVSVATIRADGNGYGEASLTMQALRAAKQAQRGNGHGATA